MNGQELLLVAIIVASGVAIYRLLRYEERS